MDDIAIDIAKIQYKEALETFRNQYDMAIKILSLFFTSYLALVGFALNQKSDTILAFASIIPFAMLFITIEIRRHMAPFVYVCLRFEDKYTATLSLMRTYISSVFVKESFDKIQSIVKDNTFEPSMAVRKMNAQTKGALSTLLRYAFGSFLILHFGMETILFFLWRQQ